MEVELQAVATQSPTKALDVLENFLWDARSQETEHSGSAMSAAVALGEMQGGLNSWRPAMNSESVAQGHGRHK